MLRRDQVLVSVRRTADGKFDPMLMAIVFGVCGVIFFILLLTVPAAMAANDPGPLCGYATTLHRDEQQVCDPQRKDTYISEAQKEAAKFVKTYRLKNSDLTQIDGLHRFRTWSMKGNLVNGPLVFPITCSLGVFFDMNITCKGDKCETVKMYFLRYDYWKNANKHGEFDEGLYSWKLKDFQNPQNWNSRLDTWTTYYLVFSNSKLDSTISYDIHLDYSVYNLKKFKAYSLNDKNQVSFDDVTTSEFIVQDYVDDDNKAPKTINATISGTKTRTPTIIALVIVFFILFIFFTAVAIMFVLFMFGKLGHLGQVLSRKFQQREFGYTSAFSQQTVSDGAVITRERLITEEYE